MQYDQSNEPTCEQQPGLPTFTYEHTNDEAERQIKVSGLKYQAHFKCSSVLPDDIPQMSPPKLVKVLGNHQALRY